MRGSWWGRIAGAAALVLCAARPVTAGPPLDILYEIDVTISPADHTIGGVATLTIANHSGLTLNDLMLTLYPNIYREPNAALSRAKFENIYPHTFSPGSMTITAIETAEGTPIEYGVVDYAGPQSHTLARAFLPRPLPTGQSMHLRIAFTTTIPEKVGIFGHTQGITLLKGGWHPFVSAFRAGEWAVELLPDPARFEVRITAPRAMNLAGADLIASDPQSGTETWRHRSTRRATVALAFSPFYQQRVQQDGETRLRYFYLPENRRYVREVMDSLHRGLTFYRKEYGKSPVPEIVVASGYLHQDLGAGHEGLMVISTRLFKVFPPLKKYHDAELVKGLLFTLWRGRLPDEEAWVLEGLAEAGTQIYLRERYRRAPNLLRLLKPFAFHPIVDQILYSKNLPLRQIYFKESTPIVPREDLSLFNNKRPDGSTMFFKLTALLGMDTVNEVFQRYVDLASRGEAKPFRVVVQEVTGRDLDWFYRQWLSVNPSTDFAIRSAHQVRHADGYHTTLEVTKEGEGVEPVTIRLHQRQGPPLTTTWLSYESAFHETFVTPSAVQVVELDPEHKTSDFQRANDRTPPAIKFILEKFPGVSYDFQTKMLSYDFSAYFQRRYDEHNILRISYARNENSTSGLLTFNHSFDRRVLAYSTRQSLSLGVASSRQFVAPGSITTTTEAPFTAVRVSHVLSNAQVPLGYSDEVQQLLFGAIPYSTLTTTLSQKVLGSDHPYALLARVDMRRQWAFGTLHELAGRALFGQSAGGFHEERRFTLGGSGGMRGYSPTNLIGESILLGSLEYRRPVFRELDANIWGLTLLRRLQVAVFGDIGAIPGDRYRTDAGAGFRLTHEFLGLYPVVTRFDIAFPIGVEDRLKPDEQNPHFYVTAGQPF
ncbi:MAG: hypothetical protein ABIO65_06050 [Nitrospiria bacterium]